MKKRGLSRIITIILLILIIIVAIGIIWNVVGAQIIETFRESFGDKSSQGKISCFSLNIKPIKCEFNTTAIHSVKIKRGIGNEEINEIKFLFKTVQGKITISSINSISGKIPEEFSSSTFKLAHPDLIQAQSVDIAPVINGLICNPINIPINCFDELTNQQGGQENFYPLTTYAYSWDNGTTSPNNLIPFYWLKKSKLDSNGLSTTTKEAKNTTDKMPQNHKVMLIWNDLLNININETDVIKNATGDIQYYTYPLGTLREGETNNYQDIWWENGIEQTKGKLNEFFNQYKSINGNVDIIILDLEIGLSNWKLSSKAKSDYGGNACDLVDNGGTCNDENPLWEEYQEFAQNNIDNYYFAIKNDLRYQVDIQPNLSFTNITTVSQYWEHQTNYLEWNSLSKERVANKINLAVYDSIKQNYPNIKVSNYGHKHWSKDYPIPDFNGHKTYLFRNGSHIGTHQSENGLYARLNYITSPNKLFQGFTYEKTPFNAFRFEINKIRSMKLSSKIPIYSWISHKSWNQSLIYKTNFYEELIFHIGLTNSEQFLYWNPYNSNSPSDKQNDLLLSNLLNELDIYTGFTDKQEITYNYNPFTNETWWMSDYILSGMIAGEQNIWRFTPDTLNSTFQLISNENPTIFETQQYRIAIPQGKILDNNISTIGFWISQPVEAETITIEQI